MSRTLCQGPLECPFESQLLVDTNSTQELQTAINQHMEARHIRPLRSNQKSHYQVNRVEFQEAQVLGISHSDALKVTSEPFQSAHVVIPLSGGVSQRSTDGMQLISPGEGLIISPGEQMDMQWKPDTVAMTMRVPETTVQRYLNDYFDLPLYDSIRFDGKFDWENTESRVLREMLSGICKELKNPQSLFSRGISNRAVEEQLILTFIDALPSNYSHALKHGHSNYKSRHVKLAIEYVMANAKAEILSKDLVEVTGVSLRTLQNGFKHHCGVTPSVWIRNYKLSCIRDALTNPKYDETTIGDLAARWGLFHVSNFGRNYFVLFGERPSDTRRTRFH